MQRPLLPRMTTASARKSPSFPLFTPLTFQPRTAPNAPPQTPAITTPIPFFNVMPQRTSHATENFRPFPGQKIPAFSSRNPISTKKETDKLSAAENSDQNSGNFLPAMIEEAVQRALFHPKNGFQLYLEPMIRQSIRRALAEQMESSQHFSPLNASAKLAWRLKALFSSRSFDDIVFERTRRYQVVEVFLLQRGSNQLISYASNDPSRHYHSKKIQKNLKQLVKDCRNHLGQLLPDCPLPDGRCALTRKGKFAYLIAIMRGSPNPLIESDLDYAILQIEQRFRERLQNNPIDLMRPLQPVLESCLLIQSPAAPH